jgi:hypothetical protein
MGAEHLLGEPKPAPVRSIEGALVSSLDRFLDLVRRDLHADDVEITPAGDIIAAAPTVLVADLEDGRHLVARFPSPPSDPTGVARRFHMLIDTFPSVLGGHTMRRAEVHGSPGDALDDELRGLAARAKADDALVLDAHSPIVWGAASRPSPVPESSRQALEAVRKLHAIAELPRGRHIRHLVCDERGGYVAHSFASIYVLLLVYGALFDELRAEREALEALPRIEALVVALPPIDPSPRPVGEVISFRRRRHRVPSSTR